ncbi:MAG: twin-arginine translocase TatA/TatE family subunit [Solirubrobacteraceae bacterium]|jgi:sec-independent protein translocase protein TatA
MGLDNPLHIAFLLIVLLLVFGAKRLPEMGRSIGSGMREFKESLTTPTTTAITPAPEPAATVVQAQEPAPVAAPVGEPHTPAV